MKVENYAILSISRGGVIIHGICFEWEKEVSSCGGIRSFGCSIDTCVANQRVKRTKRPPRYRLDAATFKSRDIHQRQRRGPHAQGRSVA